MIVGKHVQCNPKMPPVDLRHLCEKIRESIDSANLTDAISKNPKADWSDVPDSAYDLLRHLMDLNPLTRISADSALNHPFFTEQIQQM